MSVIVGRPYEGITINPLEYLLDGETPKIFDDKEQAIKFLKKHRCTDEDIEWLEFKDVEPAKCPRCGWPLLKSDLVDYDFVCMNCDENFYRFEVRGCRG